MSKCLNCKKYEDCKTGSGLTWPCGAYAPKVITNADHIRSMTDEELAEWIHNGISTDPCDYCECNNDYCDGAPCRGKADAETIVDWLKRPYKEGS